MIYVHINVPLSNNNRELDAELRVMNNNTINEIIDFILLLSIELT